MRLMSQSKTLKEDKILEINLRACKFFPNCDKRRSTPLLKEDKKLKK